jgi:hypothetical protein
MPEKIASGGQPAKSLGGRTEAGALVGAAQDRRPRRGLFLSHRGRRTAPKLTMTVHSGQNWDTCPLVGFCRARRSCVWTIEAVAALFEAALSTKGRMTDSDSRPRKPSCSAFKKSVDQVQESLNRLQTAMDAWPEATGNT